MLLFEKITANVLINDSNCRCSTLVSLGKLGKQLFSFWILFGKEVLELGVLNHASFFFGRLSSVFVVVFSTGVEHGHGTLLAIIN